MATRYFCDKCDTKMDSKDSLGNVSFINVPTTHLVRNVSEFSEKKLELCGRCMMLLVEFLRPDAKQAPNR
jgi:hypothetical protein